MVPRRAAGASAWTGDTNRAPIGDEPGGWIFNVLPLVEQTAMHDLGAGLPTAQKNAANYQRMCIPLGNIVLSHAAEAAGLPVDGRWPVGRQIINAGQMVAVRADHDYAANGGDCIVVASAPPNYLPYWPYYVNADGGPTSMTEVENPGAHNGHRTGTLTVTSIGLRRILPTMTTMTTMTMTTA